MGTQILPDPIPQWLSFMEQQGKAERTISGYTTDVRDFARWYQDAFGEKFVAADVLPRDVRDYKAFIQTVRKLAPRTINRKLAAISRFFKWALDNSLVRQDPTTRVRTLRLPSHRPQALTLIEERRLLRAVHRNEKLRDIAIVEVMLGTGIRVGELLSLQRGDIVLKARSGTLFVRRGKGGTSRRIPLRASTRKALRDYLEHLPKKLRGEDPLWWGIRGSLRSPSAINRILEKYALQTEVEETTPHILRHTFATRYLEANPGDLRGLASLLGHSSLDTVMIYTEPNEEDLLERLERMEKPLL